MRTFEQALRDATEELKTAGVPEPDLNAWHLLAYSVALGRKSSESEDTDDLKHAKKLHDLSPDRSWYILHSSDEVGNDIIRNYERVLSYRKKGCPLEYITHITEFMGLPFYVDPSVLIPRQDTECLVEEAIRSIGRREAKDSSRRMGFDVLDLCTGSGCIAVSVSVLGNCRSVTATDLSGEALRVARINAGLNNVDVSFFQGDLFDALKKGEHGYERIMVSGHDNGETDIPSELRFDLITCNPPYIRHDIIPGLMREVREYEPVMALDGGTDGLEFYKRVLSEIDVYLRSGGRLIFEIGFDQGRAVGELMSAAGLTDVMIRPDLAGNDRIAVGVKP
ncbi:MAG: peptide chain release factor N(5)-glutamine methyltransferase [Eubacterium sp.]|nr:peptide chain release factor N(5)-glutamine methyltransferase [Eubacterium sp.]